ncbi:ABC transporter permease [Xanthomonas melonis]|uniref:Transport permease protein n=1 Tax=Xanthomonas melonis TaxID=56456 RepID=A0ABS8NZV5_9XANT|nr:MULTISPECIES: ABC transporter permease [Xanthomonas]MCC4586092.1 ABC transporter permease [Xanthomonas sp. NCPPB 1067]MCD0246702.1 ABC transporter permease [Xanthomonas melonis]MCD0260444.1 ABC transporter permease [Xanthomonas melonis]MCD0268646.1 ABC transporter permease [Xanthomonas melonis]
MIGWLISRYSRLPQLYYLYSQMVRRDIERRYKATAGGMLWAIIQPVLMIGIYTVVFGLIFQPRWPSVQSSWDYVLILFLGKIPYLFVTEALASATISIRSHANLVKKAVFPLKLLPGVSVGTSAYHAVVASLVWVVFYVVIKGAVPLAVLLLPLLWLPMLMFCLGACWFLASFGAYFRDTDQIVGTFNIALMFLSPIFYPLSSVPAPLRHLMLFNPLSYAIESARALMLWPDKLDLSTYPLHLVVGFVFMLLGYTFFNRMRSGFADAI